MDASATRSGKSSRVLIIDGDPSLGGVVEGLVQDCGYEIRTAAAGGSGVEQLREWRPDIVLLNDRLPDQPGLGVLPQILKADPHVAVLYIASDDAAESAIEAIRRGAFDYFTKPLSLEQLRQSIEQARENRRLLRAPLVVRTPDSAASDPDRLIGRCEAMQRVYKAIGRIAAHDQPALIVGPPGVGKRLVARAIHQHGVRSTGPFVSVRCGDHAGEDLESVLFAGTDAAPAATQQAHGGVLLLEEFETVSLPLQARLLGLVRQSMSAGAAQRAESSGTLLLLSFGLHVDQLPPTSRAADSTTLQHPHRPFIRADLYYELAGNTLLLPPLRQRGDDIRLLVEHYVQRLSSAGPVLPDAGGRISAEALELVHQYNWPGNITELKSVLRRALIESRGTIIASDYLRQALSEPPLRRPEPLPAEKPSAAPAWAPPAAAGPTVSPADVDWESFMASHTCDDRGGEAGLYAAAVEEMERGLIAALLRRTEGNLAQAARLLGMTRVSLRKKILKLDLAVPGRQT